MVYVTRFTASKWLVKLLSSVLTLRDYSRARIRYFQCSLARRLLTILLTTHIFTCLYELCKLCIFILPIEYSWKEYLSSFFSYSLINL